MNEGEEIKAISLPDVQKKVDALKMDIQCLIYKFTKETGLNIEVEIENTFIQEIGGTPKIYFYAIKTTVIL